MHHHPVWTIQGSLSNDYTCLSVQIGILHTVHTQQPTLTCKLWPPHSRRSSEKAVHIQVHNHALRWTFLLLLLLLLLLSSQETSQPCCFCWHRLLLWLLLRLLCYQCLNARLPAANEVQP
jgi:hypothetical protein